MFDPELIGLFNKIYRMDRTLSDNAPIAGEVRSFRVGSTIPGNWMPCDGVSQVARDRWRDFAAAVPVATPITKLTQVQLITDAANELPLTYLGNCWVHGTKVWWIDPLDDVPTLRSSVITEGAGHPDVDEIIAFYPPHIQSTMLANNRDGFALVTNGSGMYAIWALPNNEGMLDTTWVQKQNMNLFAGTTKDGTRRGCWSDSSGGFLFIVGKDGDRKYRKVYFYDPTREPRSPELVTVMDKALANGAYIDGFSLHQPVQLGRYNWVLSTSNMNARPMQYRAAFLEDADPNGLPFSPQNNTGVYLSSVGVSPANEGAISGFLGTDSYMFEPYTHYQQGNEARKPGTQFFIMDDYPRVPGCSGAFQGKFALGALWPNGQYGQVAEAIQTFFYVGGGAYDNSPGMQDNVPVLMIRYGSTNGVFQAARLDQTPGLIGGKLPGAVSPKGMYIHSVARAPRDASANDQVLLYLSYYTAAGDQVGEGFYLATMDSQAFQYTTLPVLASPRGSDYVSCMCLGRAYPDKVTNPSEEST